MSWRDYESTNVEAAAHLAAINDGPDPDWDRPTDRAAEDAWYARWAHHPIFRGEEPRNTDSERAAA